MKQPKLLKTRRRKKPQPPKHQQKPRPKQQLKKLLPLKAKLPLPKQDNPFILVGKITAAHGIRGQVKLASYTSPPENITTYGPLYNAQGKQLFELKITGGTNTSFIATIPGIKDRNEAEAILGTELYIPRSALPATRPGEYYHHDLVGLKVVSPEGEDLGEVIGIHNYGAGDLLEIKHPDAKETELYPHNKKFFPEINVAAGRITLILPEIITTLPQEEDDHQKP